MKKGIIICIIVILLIIILGITIIAKQKGEKTLNNNSNSTTSNMNSIENLPIIQGEKKNYDSNRTVKKVTMTVKEDTLTNKGATVIIIDSNDYPYTYDKWFKIEKKNNNEWSEVTRITDKYIIVGLATTIIRKDGTLDEKINWEDLYGELESGEYRLFKRVSDNEDYEYFFVEFTIE